MIKVENETLIIDEVSKLLHDHDIKLAEHSTRLNTLENLMHSVFQKYPIYWENIEE